MRIQIRPLILTFTILISLYSCSSKTMIPVKPISLPDLSRTGIDSLLLCPEIDLSFYKPDVAAFFTPPCEITETFNSFEKNNIRAKDNKLFAKQKALTLDLTSSPDSTFTFPLPGAKVISPYGTRRGRNHTGIDLKTKANDTIIAAFSGIVRVSKFNRSYGNVVVVRHYNGLETVYSHNSKNLVQSGDRITAGTPIGLTGRTGRATTEHVHFEIRVNGEHFDPKLIIDFNNNSILQKCLIFTPVAGGKIQIKQTNNK